MSRTKPLLSREKIAAVAIAIADKDGFDAVTMRRLAQEIGVGTMSLYHYVRTKDDLVSIMDDALMGEVLLPSVPSDWRQAMLEIARRTHATLVRHPWALASMLSAAPGLNAMRHMEQCLEALAQTALTPKQKVTLLATVDDFVFGNAMRTAAREASVDIEFATNQLATGAFPRLSEVFGRGVLHASQDRFEDGLRALLGATAPTKKP